MLLIGKDLNDFKGLSFLTSAIFPSIYVKINFGLNVDKHIKYLFK